MSEKFLHSPETIKNRPFQEQLVEVWKKVCPGAMEADVKQQKNNFTDVKNREGVISRKELFFKILQRRGVKTENLEIDEKGYIHLTVKNHFSEKALSHDYGYKGSAARTLLLRNTQLDKYDEPRDIDIIRLAQQEPYDGADYEMAKKFMPEDFAHGHGVEPINDIETYFKTRDFTVNEVLATDTEIIATKQCILDTARHVIRLTEYEKTEISNKMLSKALRIFSDFIQQYGEAEIKNIEEWRFEENFITPFWLALQLDKAFGKGSEYAKQFVAQLRKKKQIPEEIKTPEEAAKYLLNLMYDDSFYYRHAPAEQFEDENKLIDEYENLPIRVGIKRSLKKNK